jgi:hypothetical protein
VTLPPYRQFGDGIFIVVRRGGSSDQLRKHRNVTFRKCLTVDQRTNIRSYFAYARRWLREQYLHSALLDGRQDV